MPVQTALVVPFVPLAEFTAHEQQFLAGVSIQVAEQRPQVGHFQPGVSRHFVQQGPLAIDHLVMGQREYVVFAEGVPDAEGQLVVVIFTVYGVLRQIV